jgi:hypothetical protein
MRANHELRGRLEGQAKELGALREQLGRLRRRHSSAVRAVAR